jgi:hypothetical protein
LISNVIDDLAHGASIASNGRDRPLTNGIRHGIPLEDLEPTHQRLQRSAQFVRQHCEELFALLIGLHHPVAPAFARSSADTAAPSTLPAVLKAHPL